MSRIGLNYKPVNNSAAKNLGAFQNILTVAEEQFCINNAEKMRQNINSIKTPILPNDTTETVLNRLKPELTGMIMSNNGLTETEKPIYIKAILNFAKIVLNNSSDKGLISEKLFKEQLLNMFNSFCAPTGPASSPVEKSKFGAMTNTTKWSIGIGSVVLLIIIGILIWYFMKKKKGSAAPVVPLPSSFGRIFTRR